MKRTCLVVFPCLLAVLAFPPTVRADNSPATAVVIPEVIWAPATGGGTWVTALQVTAKSAGTGIYVQFHYGTGSRTVLLASSTADYQTFRYANILQTLGALDTGFNYSGRVGALLIMSYPATGLLWAQAMTTNGNYGKTMPGVVWAANDNTCDIGRYMVIPGIVNSPAFRTFVGAWNSRNDTMEVRFYVMRSDGYNQYGNVVKFIGPYQFVSFNPFAELGLSGENLMNCWLLIWPASVSGGSGEGLFCYGSIANNYTNDTYAMIAVPFK